MGGADDPQAPPVPSQVRFFEEAASSSVILF